MENVLGIGREGAELFPKARPLPVSRTSAPPDGPVNRVAPGFPPKNFVNLAKLSILIKALKDLMFNLSNALAGILYPRFMFLNLK